MMHHASGGIDLTQQSRQWGFSPLEQTGAPAYADVKKKKIKQVVHATGDNEATQSFEQTGHPLNEDNYNEVYENILQQLMETDECDKLRVWTSDVEKRDVYLTAKKTSPAWKRVIMRKTVDVDTNKVIQVKYIGSENWGNLHEAGKPWWDLIFTGSKICRIAEEVFPDWFAGRERCDVPRTEDHQARCHSHGAPRPMH